jgi:hypothetical protein
MAVKKSKTTGVKRKKVAKRAARPAAQKGAPPEHDTTDVPQFFRLNIEVGNLDRAAEFYGKLFAVKGRRQAGARVYFDAGPVTLQIVDVSSTGAPHPAAKALYFTVKDLEAVHGRARSLDALSKELVHGIPGGNIVMRPWGERSFYAEDPWANPLCFIEAGTTYPG